MAGSRRLSPRPGNWKTIKRQVHERDGWQCVWVEHGIRCPATTGLECDHIGDRDDHHLDNLRTLCTYHHGKRTAAQALAARLAHSTKRPARRHPGLI